MGETQKWRDQFLLGAVMGYWDIYYMIGRYDERKQSDVIIAMSLTVQSMG